MIGIALHECLRIRNKGFNIENDRRQIALQIRMDRSIRPHESQVVCMTAASSGQEKSRAVSGLWNSGSIETGLPNRRVVQPG